MWRADRTRIGLAMTGLAKLIAFDTDDLSVISAHCQDAICKVSELEFDRKSQQFIVPLRRYAWEAQHKRKWWHWRTAKGQRRDAVLQFQHVRAAQTQNLPATDTSALVLLSAVFHTDELPEGEIVLHFADNIHVKLQVDALEAKLTDLGGVWQALAQPRHEG